MGLHSEDLMEHTSFEFHQKHQECPTNTYTHTHAYINSYIHIHTYTYVCVYVCLIYLPVRNHAFNNVNNFKILKCD